MCEQLPESFHESKGGGWSFLNMCEDKGGNQWSGTHKTMEQLLCLGMAMNKMKILLPREVWKIFPGGMPYVAIL